MGNEFRKYWPRGLESEGYKDEDEWWRVRLFIYGFNEACSNIARSYLKVRDEFMSVIQFRTMSKGNLLHLYYIFRNLEPLGTYFKTVSCFVTWALIFLEIHRGKERMKSIWYHLELGATAACTKILMEETKGLGQRALKGSTRDFFHLWKLVLAKESSIGSRLHLCSFYWGCEN